MGRFARCCASLVVTIVSIATIGSAQNLVRDINAQVTPRHSDPGDYVVLGTQTLFAAKNSAAGEELFAANGPGQAALLFDIEPGSAGGWPRDLVVLGNRVYFSAWTSTVGREHWRTGYDRKLWVSVQTRGVPWQLSRLPNASEEAGTPRDEASYVTRSLRSRFRSGSAR